MSASRGTLGILGLVLSLGVMLLTAWLLLRSSAPPASTSVGSTQVGSPQLARRQVLHQLCLAQCATDEHDCRALVTEPGGETACTSTRATCERACPP